MFQLNDIVAVYGETPVANTINDTHPSVTDSLLTAREEDIPHIIEAADRYTLCQVRRIIKAKMGYVLIVSKVSKPDSQYAVHERQCRLVERGGQKVVSKQARYVATLVDENYDRSDFQTAHTIDSITCLARSKKEEWESEYCDNHDSEDMIEVDVRFYKGIDITDEVRL